MKKIPLSRGKFAIVDDEDYERLMAMGKWCVSEHYAVKSIGFKDEKGRWKSKTILMHRFLLDAPYGVQVDHRNENKLDNRKENLRLCNHGENMSNRGISRNNSSGYKGVCWDKRCKKWKAAINVNGKKKHIGDFKCVIEAAKAYNAAALKYQGEFAKLNEIK